MADSSITPSLSRLSTDATSFQTATPHTKPHSISNISTDQRVIQFIGDHRHFSTSGDAHPYRSDSETRQFEHDPFAQQLEHQLHANETYHNKTSPHPLSTSAPASFNHRVTSLSRKTSENPADRPGSKESKRFKEIAVKPAVAEIIPHSPLAEQANNQNLFSRMKSALKDFFEFTEKGNEAAGTTAKAGQAVVGAEAHEAIGQSSLRFFDKVKEKLEKGFLVSELIAVPFFFISAVNYVCQLKSAISHKVQYAKLKNEILRLEKSALADVKEINSKKEQLKLMKDKLQIDKDVIPKTFTVAAFLMKSVKTTSELITFLAPKGAKLSPTAMHSLALAATILLPLSVGISIGVGIYYTYKGIKEYRKLGQEIREVQKKMEQIPVYSKTQTPAEAIGLLSFKVLQENKLRMQKDQLVEGKRLAVLEIASNSLLLASGALTLGSMYAGPAAPFLLGGSLSLLIASGGVEIYKHFSHKRNEKIMTQNHEEKYKLNQADFTSVVARISTMAMRSPEIREFMFNALEMPEDQRKDLEGNSEKTFAFFAQQFNELQQKAEKEILVENDIDTVISVRDREAYFKVQNAT